MSLASAFVRPSSKLWGLGAAMAASAGLLVQPDMRGLVTSAHADAQKSAGSLNPKEFLSFKVLENERLTHNTHRVRFEMPNNAASGLHVASCLVVRVMLPEADGTMKAAVKPYTPVTSPDTRGHMDLIVKGYPTGKVSKHIVQLKVGDTVDMKGPIPKYPYEANLKKNIGMVAGGTGITPMLQVIEAVLSNPQDQTQLSLVYANMTPKDIILKKKLDELAVKHADRFKVFYVVDRAGWLGSLTWRGGKGFITQDLLKAHLPPPAKENLVMVCGPPGMMAAISGGKAPDFSQGEVSGALKAMGYTSSHVYKF